MYHVNLNFYGCEDAIGQFLFRRYRPYDVDPNVMIAKQFKNLYCLVVESVLNNCAPVHISLLQHNYLLVPC